MLIKFKVLHHRVCKVSYIGILGNYTMHRLPFYGKYVVYTFWYAGSIFYLFELLAPGSFDSI